MAMRNLKLEIKHSLIYKIKSILTIRTNFLHFVCKKQQVKKTVGEINSAVCCEFRDRPGYFLFYFVFQHHFNVYEKSFFLVS